MPELPEVETSRRGIAPHVVGKTLKRLVIREYRLRWPIPKSLPEKIVNKKLTAVERRGKYLLLHFDKAGSVIIHLGMSGSLRICNNKLAAEKHDHVDFVFNQNTVLRLRDPRKFGCVLWSHKPEAQHRLLQQLGPEPLSDEFNGDYLHRVSRKRSCSIKSLIMNSHIVVGVGNIYASESLFLAAINPKRKAGTLSRQRCDRLVAGIKTILNAAIEQGGTTLRDFTREDGKPGYFVQQLKVYGRAGESCTTCGNAIKQFNQQQRSTFYCSRCQR